MKYKKTTIEIYYYGNEKLEITNVQEIYDSIEFIKILDSHFSKLFKNYRTIEFHDIDFNLTGLSLVFKDDICDNYKELLQKYSYDDTSYKIFYEERIIYGSKYTIVQNVSIENTIKNVFQDKKDMHHITVSCIKDSFMNYKEPGYYDIEVHSVKRDFISK